MRKAIWDLRHTEKVPSRQWLSDIHVSLFMEIKGYVAGRIRGPDHGAHRPQFFSGRRARPRAQVPRLLADVLRTSEKLLAQGPDVATVSVRIVEIFACTSPSPVLAVAERPPARRARRHGRVGPREGGGQSPKIQKHGVDFADAATVLSDDLALTLPDDNPDEERSVTVGMDALGRVLVVVYTRRKERIRLISARKATSSERREYERAR